MTDIIVDRSPHVVTNPIYDMIAMWLLIGGLTFFILLTIIAFIIRQKNWLDTKFDRRVIINVFFMALIVIVSIALFNYKEYDKIEEYVTYTGTVTDVGSNYVVLDNDKKGQTFYDESLKAKNDIQPNERLDKQGFGKGDTVKIKTTKSYSNIGEMGTRSDFSVDDTYNITKIEK